MDLEVDVELNVKGSLQCRLGLSNSRVSDTHVFRINCRPNVPKKVLGKCRGLARNQQYCPDKRSKWPMVMVLDFEQPGLYNLLVQDH